MDFRPLLRRAAFALLRGIARVRRAGARTLLALPGALGALRSSRLVRGLLSASRRALRVAVPAALLVALALAFEAFCLVRIEPGEIGVRQREWGSSRGVEALDHPGPALFVSWPGRVRWQRLDGRTRVETFAPPDDGGTRPPLEVRTREGNAATVWAGVPYRIRPGSAHRLVADGARGTYPRQVATTIEKVLTQEFARLASDEFHDPAARRSVCDGALARLADALAPLHVEALGVWIRAVEFPPTYEKTQQEQQLRSQSVLTQEVLDGLAARQLENQFVAHAVARDHSALLTRLTRAYDAAQRAAREEIELQAARNQGLARELEAERAVRAAQLDELHAQARHNEEQLALAELAQRKRELEDELAREEAELTASLGLEFEDLHRVGEQELARLVLDQREVEQALEQELGILRAAAQGELEEARREHASQVSALRRAGERRAREVRDAAELRHDARLVEADLLLEAAAVERERLRGEVLASRGGRLWLAREAARRVRFGRVVLDPADARVPSPLELDALAALLLGSEAEPTRAPRAPAERR